MIGLIAAGPSPAYSALAAALPGHLGLDGSPASVEGLREPCDGFVSFLEPSATLRLLLPLLGRTGVAPAVVCADTAHLRTRVLLDGADGTGPRLARTVARALGDFTPPETPTAPAGRGVAVLDSLGWPVEGAARAVARALREGGPLVVRNTLGWPLPALPPAVESVQGPPGASGTAGLWVTDRVVPLGPDEAVLRPPSLTVGVGACRGTAGEEVVELVEESLDDAGLAPGSVGELVTVRAKAGEPALLAAARRFGVPLRAYPADALGGVRVPHPTAASRAAVGTPSVAEAAALLAAGAGGELVVPKAKSAPPDGSPPRATAAVARCRPLHPA